jgi:hypothetical protein
VPLPVISEVFDRVDDQTEQVMNDQSTAEFGTIRRYPQRDVCGENLFEGFEIPVRDQRMPLR